MRIIKPFFKLLFRFIFIYTQVVGTIQSQVKQNNGLVPISGIITDEVTREPIPFANITYNSGKKGAIASFDGRFAFIMPDTVSKISITSVGFENTTVIIRQDNLGKEYVIRLRRKVQELSEVIIRPGENPAHRIIEKVIQNRSTNNPEKVGSFSYTAYNKMFFTLQEDTFVKGNQLPLIIDSTETDMSELRIKNLIKNQHLFLTEFVSKRWFKFPSKNREIVESSKVSGMKDPIFVMLATQFQSFSFYNEFVNLLDRNYINPIGNGGLNRYLFILEDTIFTYLPDTVFVISYQPHKSRNFEGLKGFLYVNTNGYAVQNVTAEPSGYDSRFAIKIQQQYDFVNNKQWFPTQLNTNLIFKTSKVKTKTRELYMAGIGKSYLSDIKIDEEISDTVFSKADLEIAMDAARKTDDFWNEHRTVPLTKIDSSTYRVVDSVGAKKHLNEKMLILEAMLYGYIPIGGFNLELDKLVNYNKYEGTKLGLKLSTNPKIFSFASVSGFYIYGLKDKYSKYGGSVQLFPRWYSDTKFTLKYAHNVAETGGYNFLDDYTLNSSEFIRSYYISKMDKTDEYEVAFQFRMLKYLKLNAYLNRSDKLFNKYVYLDPSIPGGISNQMIFTEAGFQLKLAWGEKFLKTPRGKLISMGTQYPVVWLNYRRGLTIFDGEKQYNKVEAKISGSFLTKSFGKSQIQIKAGKIFEDVPLANNYSALGCYESFGFDVENYFVAVRPGEFFSSSFTAAFFRQNFGPLIFGGSKFKPEFVFVTNAGWGSLQNKWKHVGDDFKTMEKGYFESGLMLNKLFNVSIVGFGIGVYYRYGYYAYDKVKDNFAYKIGFTYTL